MLRDALNNVDSLNAVAQTTGVQLASLIRFRRGDQTITLDAADKLADYFGIECRQTTRKD